MSLVLTAPPPPAVTPATAPAPLLPAAGLHRFTGEEYERLIALGAFTPEDRLELLDGFLLDKMSEGLPHAHALHRLTKHFFLRAGDRWTTRSQSAVRLDGPWLPEPDVVLLHPPDELYIHRRPAPADILLLVEVSETSLATDRGDKLRAYARAAVPEYWIVNLPERVVEVHHDPDPAAGRYAAVGFARPGESLAPAAAPDAALPVGELFG